MLNMKLRPWLAGFAVLLALQTAANAQLASRPADEWAKTLDSPERVESLRITDVVQKLKIKPGNVVADIGAGTGLFEGALAAAVGPTGVVYAEDVDQALLDHLSQRAKTLNVTNVRTVLGGFTDPKLPVKNVDLAFINDVLHHVEDRAGFLKNLATYIKPGGRVAIIDFNLNQGSHKDQPSLQISKEQAATWMAAAGFKPSEDVAMFSDKWFSVYSR